MTVVHGIGPTRLRASTALISIPGLADQFVRIPDSFWNIDGDFAVVACPCGRTPEVELAGLTECDCHRFFFHGGKFVMVANGPKQRPPPRWERIVQKWREHQEAVTEEEPPGVD